MAAASRYTPTSPTAQLLRSSRLFSLPKPLPRPGPKVIHKSAFHYDSPHATSPYPTHQVLTTTHASRARGDWGLKRSLPAKSTSRATTIRVKEQDTLDQIVEFEHAGDHALALTKLQDLHLAITRPIPKGTDFTHRAYHDPSAFETEFDNTAPVSNPLTPEEQALRTATRESSLPARWRRRGPALAEMNMAEFAEYLENEVAPRSQEFIRELQWRAIQTYIQLAKDKSATSENQALKIYHSWLAQLSPLNLYNYIQRRAANGSMEWFKGFSKSRVDRLEGPTEEIRSLAEYTESWLTSLVEPTQRQEIHSELQQMEEALPQALKSSWQQYLVNFRNAAGEDLTDLATLEGFLDLAPDVRGSTANAFQKEKQLSTHPSAGLSYRRTSQTLTNDALFGPLMFEAPHTARFLPLPVGLRTTYMSARAPANFTVGLAGVVVSRELISAQPQSGMTDERTPRGGEKLLVSVAKAQITPAGRINIEVRAAGEVERAVKQGRLAKSAVEDQEMREAREGIESVPQDRPSNLPAGHARGRPLGSGIVDVDNVL